MSRKRQLAILAGLATACGAVSFVVFHEREPSSARSPTSSGAEPTSDVVTRAAWRPDAPVREDYALLTSAQLERDRRATLRMLDEEIERIDAELRDHPDRAAAMRRDFLRDRRDALARFVR